MTVTNKMINRAKALINTDYPYRDKNLFPLPAAPYQIMVDEMPNKINGTWENWAMWINNSLKWNREVYYLIGCNSAYVYPTDEMDPLLGSIKIRHPNYDYA